MKRNAAQRTWREPESGMWVSFSATHQVWSQGETKREARAALDDAIRLAVKHRRRS